MRRLAGPRRGSPTSRLEVADVAPKSSQSGPASRLARPAQDQPRLLQ